MKVNSKLFLENGVTSLNINGIIKGNYDREYVPAYAINIGTTNVIKNNVGLVKYYLKAIEEGLSSTIMPGEPTISPGSVDSVFNRIYGGITSQHNTYGLPERSSWSDVRQYGELWDSFEKRDQFRWVTFRGWTGMVSYRFLSIYNHSTTTIHHPWQHQGSYDILMTMVTKPEYMPYIKLKTLFNEEIDPEVFEFWIKPEFDSKNTGYPTLRAQYRKNIFPILKSEGIVIKEVPNIFNKLYNTITPPKFSRIADHSNWLKEQSASTIETIRRGASFVY